MGWPKSETNTTCILIPTAKGMINEDCADARPLCHIVATIFFATIFITVCFKTKWTMYTILFRLSGSTSWCEGPCLTQKSPVMCRYKIHIDYVPKDTYLNMKVTIPSPRFKGAFVMWSRHSRRIELWKIWTVLVEGIQQYFPIYIIQNHIYE